MPPTFSAGNAFDLGNAEEASLRWSALADAASAVAALARAGPEQEEPDGPEFADLFRDADLWRRERAEHGIADISAFMEPGIAALLSVNARGADPRPAATALWLEFTAARAAVLSLLRPGVTA